MTEVCYGFSYFQDNYGIVSLDRLRPFQIAIREYPFRPISYSTVLILNS